MILLDTSGLLAALFRDQRQHSNCAKVLLETSLPLVLSPFVLAELDYLARIDHRFGNEGDFGRPERFSESFAIDPVQVE